jgi:hypothetical protein
MLRGEEYLMCMRDRFKNRVKKQTRIAKKYISVIAMSLYNVLTIMHNNK